MAIAVVPVNHAVLPARIASFYIALLKWKEVAHHTRILVNDHIEHPVRFPVPSTALLTVLPVLPPVVPVAVPVLPPPLGLERRLSGMTVEGWAAKLTAQGTFVHFRNQTAISVSRWGIIAPYRLPLVFMTQKLKKVVLLVDYENVQNLDLSVIQAHNLDIKIFVGQAQSKIPLDLVQATQRLGKRVEWIKMDGSGSNALDFHIAFYLGTFSRRIKAASFFILSKDKGFDPLVKHLNRSSIGCQRIESLIELSRLLPQPEKVQEAIIVQDTDAMTRMLDILSKIDQKSRPKTRKSLHQYVKSAFQKKLSEQAIESLVEMLFVQKKVAEVNNRLTYNF